MGDRVGWVGPNMPLGETVLKQTTPRREIPGGVRSTAEELTAIFRSSLYEILEEDYAHSRKILGEYGLKSVKSSNMVDQMSNHRWHIYASSRGTTIEVNSHHQGFDTFTIRGTQECREQTARDVCHLAQSNSLSLEEEIREDKDLGEYGNRRAELQ